MLNLNEITQKPDIKYPIFWEYKVILEAQTKPNSLFEELFVGRDFKFSASNKNSKYQSYNLRVLVMNENERLYFFDELKKRAKFVI